MIELLKMCGFEEEEAIAELPRIEKVFIDRLGFTQADLERGKKRLERYYDMELAGVRRILRLCMLEFVKTILAREEGKKKIIFSFMSPGFEPVGSLLVSKSNEVFCANLCWSLFVIMGSIFDRLVPLLEAAESGWLKAGAVG